MSSEISVGIVEFLWPICSSHFSLGDNVPLSGGHQFCLRDISVVEEDVPQEK